jgi:hypothetical protein
MTIDTDLIILIAVMVAVFVMVILDMTQNEKIDQDKNE